MSKKFLDIKEVLDKYKNTGKIFEIVWIFEMKCYECEKWYRIEDDEYSLIGTYENWIEHIKDYPCWESANEISFVKTGEDFDTKVDYYEYVVNDGQEGLCPACKSLRG